MTQQITMLFDGGCPLCRREVGHYRRLDRCDRVCWIDISVHQHQLLSLGISPTDAMARLHVVDTGGQVHTGAKAFVTLWSALPYYRHLATLVRGLGLTGLLERLYGPFSRWRLARRRNSCPV